MRVFKYEIPITQGSHTAKIHAGCKILCVKHQRLSLVIYALVDESNPREDLIFDVVMTGSKLWAEGEYVGTVMLNSGSFVLHVFKRSLI